jgi:hypothetical protein
MLKKPEVPQQEMELMTIDSLVLGDHLLRKIQTSIDLDFHCRARASPVL